MAVKTTISSSDFAGILLQYDVGVYHHAEAIERGTVQTNYLLQTTKGRFVFRYYESRSRESVLFERDLLLYLQRHRYPCPAQVKDKRGAFIGEYGGKPFAIFDFVDGRPIDNPTNFQWDQLVKKAAELQSITRDFRSDYIPYRWNYNVDLCRRLASEEAARINTPNAHEKFEWLDGELTTLDLPPELPKGICHSDFHPSNVLFRGNDLVVLLDFDDANYTFLQFDLVGLIEYWAWPNTAPILDVLKARSVVQRYSAYRDITPLEQHHMFDVYKLSILFDCVWYFNRGHAEDFREKRKIEALNSIGRLNFRNNLFHT